MSFSLPATQREVNGQLARLSQILDDMPATAASRYALSEIVLIRAAAVFESALAAMAYKIACGATFPTGAGDRVLVAARSLQGARTAMRHEGGARANPKEFLKWTKAAFIGESVKGVLDPTCHYLQTCRHFGQQIAEIFEVRHHAAHKNSSSREKYMKWVRAQYGQDRNIQLGYFLLTTNLFPVSNIQRYLTTIKVVTEDITKGP